jgi:hypothetical protein
LASQDAEQKESKKWREQMPIQWTAHIPQALQRHGENVRPLVDADGDEAMIRLLQAIRSQTARTEGETAATPAARPSSP